MENRPDLDRNRLDCSGLYRRRSPLRVRGFHLDCLVQVLDCARLRLVLASFGLSAKRHDANDQRTNQRR